MKARSISRAVIEGYLTVARIPIDAVIDRLPGNGSGAGPNARLIVDRADASLRAAVASMLGDRTLHGDAEQRTAAADQREHALRLREQAEKNAEQADDRIEQRESDAERRRVEAAKAANAKRHQADQDRADKVKRAATAERKRKQSSERVKAQSAEEITEHANEDRLAALNVTDQALESQEQALTAADEARRLREAAGAVKAQRKDATRSDG